jgi:hypothetical protein
MSNQDVPPPIQPAAAVATGKPKNASRNRTKAMSQFNPSAPRISVDRFFSDFTEVKRNNVDVTLDPSLLDRLAAPYIDRAHDFERNRTGSSDHRRTDLVASTYALVGMAMVRKLVLSAPASVSNNISSLQYVKNMELFAPPSLCAALDNIGKITHDDFTVRVEYVEQDIYRNVVRICKVMNSHRDFTGQYPLLGGLDWATLDPERFVVPSDSSARWLQNLGRELLSEVSYANFPATVVINGQNVNVQVTFPHLKQDPSRTKQLEHIVTWLALMNPGLPNLPMLLSAAVFLIWTPLWFDRLTTTFANLDDVFVNTVLADYTPANFLDLHHFHVGSFARSPLNIVGIMTFFADVHSFISNNGPVIFDKFLKLTKQPDNQFGTLAQLLELDSEAWMNSRSRADNNFRFRNQTSDMHAMSLMKLKDKGAVTSALMFGFVTKVKYSNNFSARLNGPIATTRQLFLSSDFLNNTHQ